MGVRILSGEDAAILYCSTTDWAFGPVFGDRDTHTGTERAAAFLRWFKAEPRRLNYDELEAKYSEWLAQEDAQFATEEQEAFS
jgi:hypothetical protein